MVVDRVDGVRLVEEVDGTPEGEPVGEETADEDPPDGEVPPPLSPEQRLASSPTGYVVLEHAPLSTS